MRTIGESIPDSQTPDPATLRSSYVLLEEWCVIVVFIYTVVPVGNLCPLTAGLNDQTNNVLDNMFNFFFLGSFSCFGDSLPGTSTFVFLFVCFPGGPRYAVPPHAQPPYRPPRLEEQQPCGR